MIDEQIEHLIKNSFKASGLSNALDGTEDQKILAGNALDILSDLQPRRSK